MNVHRYIYGWRCWLEGLRKAGVCSACAEELQWDPEMLGAVLCEAVERVLA